MSTAPTASNDHEELVSWAVVEGSLDVSCERDGSIWISIGTAEGKQWVRVTAPQARGVARLLDRYADISEGRLARRNSRRVSTGERS